MKQDNFQYHSLDIQEATFRHTPLLFIDSPDIISISLLGVNLLFTANDSYLHLLCSKQNRTVSFRCTTGIVRTSMCIFYRQLPFSLCVIQLDTYHMVG